MTKSNTSLFSSFGFSHATQSGMENLLGTRLCAGQQGYKSQKDPVPVLKEHTAELGKETRNNTKVWWEP